MHLTGQIISVTVEITAIIWDISNSNCVLTITLKKIRLRLALTSEIFVKYIVKLQQECLKSIFIY